MAHAASHVLYWNESELRYFLGLHPISLLLIRGLKNPQSSVFDRVSQPCMIYEDFYTLALFFCSLMLQFLKGKNALDNQNSRVNKAKSLLDIHNTDNRSIDE